MSSPRSARLDYTVVSRLDKTPRVGDTLVLGTTEYVVASMRLCLELRPVRDSDDDDAEYED